jgi:hypothetical protein
MSLGQAHEKASKPREELWAGLSLAWRQRPDIAGAGPSLQPGAVEQLDFATVVPDVARILHRSRSHSDTDAAHSQ